MTPRHLRTLAIALTVTGLAASALGCEDYDPPPEVKLRLPEGGTYVSGDPLHFEFTEPVDPSTLVVRIWPADTDLENELNPDATPHLAACTPDSSPCEATTLTLDETGMVATLQLDPSGLGKPDVPLLVEFLPGLSDVDGNDRTARTLFNIQFSPQTSAGGSFQNGYYLIVGQTTEPLPASLRLITEFKVLEDGRMAITGAQGSVLGEAPKNTKDINEMEVNTGEDGFTIHATGTLSTDEDGDRFIETVPFEVNIAIGSIGVILHDVIVSGKVVKDDDGNDFIDGTLGFSGVDLSISEFPFDGGSATIEIIHIPEEVFPPGGPTLCGDLCGEVPQCEPPADFPGEGFCE